MADPIESKTWTTGEVLDAPDMNNYVRDNFDYMRSKSVKATGSTAFTLVSGGGTAPSAQTGTTSFGVTFTAAPLILPIIEIGSNVDVLVNVTARTTTNWSWRVATASRESSATTAGTIHWVAIGTVA